MGIIVASSSDIHSPRYLAEFIGSLKKHAKECQKAAFFILAGDIVLRGRVAAAAPVFKAIQDYCGHKDIIAVFGNEEYLGLEESFQTTYAFVKWLNDTYIVKEVGSETIGIYGTRGVLDRPTRWQRKNIPDIWKIYRNRLVKIREGLKFLKEKADRVILVTHYVPSYKMLVGEPLYAWPEMGSRELEKIIIDLKPELVIHGHAHNASRTELSINGVRLVNVAFPLRRDIVVLEV